MAHFKCLSCRSRTWFEAPSPDPLCPGCGRPLAAVGELSELIGLRCLNARPRGAQRASSERFEQISEQIRAQIARHDAARQARIDAGPA